MEAFEQELERVVLAVNAERSSKVFLQFLSVGWNQFSKGPFLVFTMTSDDEEICAQARAFVDELVPGQKYMWQKRHTPIFQCLEKKH